MVRALLVAMVALVSTATGQDAAPGFEVASIKPAPPQAPGRVSVRMSLDAARLNYTNVSLLDLIGVAYGVQHEQITGPGWLDSERFNVVAKIPAGASAAGVPEMLRRLLEERFLLKAHLETREIAAYTLAAAKNGPKLTKAESSGGVSMGISGGRAHVSGRFTMARFTDYLATRLGRPVRDQTGLEGVYEIAMEWAAEPADGGPSLFTAVQEQLGLRLTAARSAVPLVVVDSVEKAPTAN